MVNPFTRVYPHPTTLTTIDASPPGLTSPLPFLPVSHTFHSLNPGVERFAFSVVWDLDANGQILSQWAGRSLIRSCGKLTYPMVQQMIEGGFDPQVHAPNTTIPGGFTWDQVERVGAGPRGLGRQGGSVGKAGGVSGEAGCSR